MKKNICRVCAVCLLVMMLFLTSCSGGGFFAEEALQIASIESELLYDGKTKITITYSDESIDPYVFYIPQGEEGAQGAEGNGIKEVSYQHDEQNRQTEVVIKFTDESIDPVTFKVPDGLSVIGIQEGTDPTTSEPYIIFKYSDGTISAPMFLPRGEKGNGIKIFDVQPQDDKSVVVDIELDDGRKTHIVIPAPQDGNGIKSMSGTEEGKYYYIDVEYTNGETEQLKFERPAKWENGSKKPDDDYGENGDYFFDTKHGKIYCKSGGIWAEAVDFNIEKYTVIFDLNDDVDTPASMPTSASIFKVERGSYFSADGNGDIPIPVRAGSEFGGWYAKKHVNELTMSPFTDFTPVFSDLTLYARWIPINN